MMSAPILRVTGYRFRATFGRRWAGYVSVVLLIGLVGGLAMGAVVAARRTQSSFPRLLRSTNPSDLIVYHADSSTDDNATDAGFRRTIAHLPHVKRVASVTIPSGQVLGPDGTPDHDAAHALFNSEVVVFANLDGLAFDQDRPVVVDGRLPDPKRADEMVMTADAAALLHLQVGDTLPYAIYTNQQTLLPTYGTGKQTPVRRIDLRVVGIVAFHFEIVRDDFDRALTIAMFSPALTTPLEKCCENGVLSGLQLAGGRRDDAVVEGEIKQALPDTRVLHITSVEEATAERAIAPQAIALGAFGAIAALAALLIAGQAISRQLRLGGPDLDALRALGAGPAMTVADGLIGAFGAILAGTLLAAVVTVALSPLSPLGPVRHVDRAPGVAFDWTVLGFGSAVLIMGLCALALTIAYRQAPHRVARRSQLIAPRGSRVATLAATSGLPVSGVAGMRLALDPGRDTRAVPVRSATLGAVLAIVVVVATVIFGTSLNTLVSHPALYGWNWNDELLAPFGGIADVPQPQTGRLLDRDPNVAAWANVSFDNLRIDGHTVPVLGTTPRAAVAPPVLSGHAFDAANQIVLGASTLASLHKHIGETVEFDNGATKPTRLTIVGTATLPAIGVASSLHLEIGTGAVVSEDLIPFADRGFGDLTPASPEAVLIRFRRGADPVAARRSLERIANEANVMGHGPLSVVGVQRPAEIVNYRTMGATPALLGGALATGAVVALGLTLIASVRRRRRDLALLKTLGFTRRQLAATVAWQASVAVVLGIIVGVPLGIIVGRSLWDLFAKALHVVPEPTIPALAIALVAAGALVLVNLVAAVPGLQAAGTRTAVLLHAE